VLDGKRRGKVNIKKRRRGIRPGGGAILFFIFFAGLASPAFPQTIIIDHNCTDLSRIPRYWLEQAKRLTLHFAHTSHGSQINSGILNLESLDSDYSVAIRTSSSEGLPPEEDPPALRIYDGNPPETYITPEDYWETESGRDRTRAVAGTGSYDFSLWSWCGQVSYYSASQINDYLDRLNQFENEFSGMRFIYMTGHLDGNGSNGTLHQNNERIRDYCRDNNKVLFDFADIERYDPEGVDYLDLGADDNCDYYGGNWAREWCAAHSGSDLCDACSCAHSQSLNCNLKGRAFWWMMARLAGWSGETTAPTPIPSPTSPHPIIDSGDYDGDGSSDIAVFRGNSGLWAIRGVTRLYCGSASDLPVSGDYDGDGSSDVAVFRPSSGLWGIRNISRTYFGGSSDQPFPGDYDGDGTCEIGIFRSESGLWALRNYTRSYFGIPGDLPSPADFDGDGAKDIALFRPSPGLWAVRNITRLYFGEADDLPLPADYDGDGSAEIAIFREGSGLWAIWEMTGIYFGESSDQPVPADYDGNVTDDPGIFRDGSGLWVIQGITRVYYGLTGDMPVTR
jgi:hypothetical protein